MSIIEGYWFYFCFIVLQLFIYLVDHLFFEAVVSDVSPVILKFIQLSCRMQEMSSIWRLKWVMLIIFAKERFGASGTALIPHMDLLPFLLDLV